MHLTLIILMVLTAANQVKYSLASPFCSPEIETWKPPKPIKIPTMIAYDRDGCTCLESPGDHTACYSQTSKSRCREFPRKAKIKNPKLILKFVNIVKLERDDFVNVTKGLSSLEIFHSRFLTTIHPFTFSDMNNLTELSLINTNLKYFNEESLIGLVNLKRLNVVQNRFTKILDISQALLPNTVPKLYSLSLKQNKFEVINFNDFLPMTNSSLEELNLFSAGISYIHSKALLPLSNLKIINLGDNQLNTSTLTKVLNESVNANIPLSRLYLESFGFKKEISPQLASVISASNITFLSLSKNSFNIINSRTFAKMRKIKHLYLSEVFLQVIEPSSFNELVNLQTLILNRNELSSLPTDLSAPNLKYLEIIENQDKTYGIQFSLTNQQFVNLSSLECLNLQSNKLLAIRNVTFLGARSLKYLNLKNCGIVHIESDAFWSLVNLEYLNMEQNNLNELWNHRTYKPRLIDFFKGLKNLHVLVLNGNGLKDLSIKDTSLFYYLTSLKKLNLSDNQIEFLTPKDFYGLNQLEVVDLSKNLLASWDSNVFFSKNLKQLHLHENKLSRITKIMLDNFYNLTNLQLEFNPFICTCSVYKQFSSYSKDKVSNMFETLERQVFCSENKNETLKDFVENPNSFLKTCITFKNIILYFAPLALMTLIFIALALLTFIYRWHIRYWIFLSRLYLTRKGKTKPKAVLDNLSYEYDAFISYCNEDQDFITRLVNMLENKEPYLKLCVYEREFKIGSIISESILEHIAKSRKTVIIVSNSYAKSYWCSWETQIAEHHRLFFENPSGEYVSNSIVLIRLDNINENHLSPTLKYLLKTRIYLQWDENEEKQKIFWQKLRSFLTPPVSTNNKDDCTRL